MMSLETQQFKLNRFLLLIIGLWPLQQSNLTRFQFIFLSSVLMMSIIFQFTTFVTSRCTPDFVTKTLSSICFFSTFAVKCNLFYLNIKAVKNLLMKLQNVCNELKDKNEIAIMKEYSCNAKRYTTALTIFGVCSASVTIIAVFWSNICFIILSKNVTQLRHLPITVEYFIDQEKHLYLILIHISVAVCIGIITMLAIGTMLITYFQYTCGMFKISSHRIKRSIPINILENIESKKLNLILKGIISAVNIHRQAMKLSELMASKIEKMLFCLIIVGVVSLSLNLFRIFQIASYGDDIKGILFPLIFVTFCILYMFIANYVAQDLTDHNNDFFAAVYDVQWHEAPLHIQKLILFLLQIGSKEFTISVGGLFVGSLKCFATLVKTSVSYFTVIYSTQ
ncbi:odorant receptor 9a-like [Polyergus mexicanus]|uniref:odorant receptor 9a-like n=1 Tax=Polyergus mexicanus TaxID=615972 RepID=UPI0038B549B4